MKNLLLVSLVCLVAALVIGFEPVERVVNETTRHGTLRGAENCISYSDSGLLADDAVRAICIRTFQQPLSQRNPASGMAGPRTIFSDFVWGGTLQSNLVDHIITWIRISVRLYDEDGTAQEFLAETAIWVDPLGESDFRVDLPDAASEQFDDIEFCEDGDFMPSSCVAWELVAIMGLKI